MSERSSCTLRVYKYNFLLTLLVCCSIILVSFCPFESPGWKIGLKSLSELGADYSRVFGCLQAGAKNFLFYFKKNYFFETFICDVGYILNLSLGSKDTLNSAVLHLVLTSEFQTTFFLYLKNIHSHGVTFLCVSINTLCLFHFPKDNCKRASFLVKKSCI